MQPDPNHETIWVRGSIIPWTLLGGLGLWVSLWVFAVWWSPTRTSDSPRCREWAALLLPASLVLFLVMTLEVGSRVYRGEIDGSFLPGGTTAMAWALGAASMLTADFFLAGLTRKYRMRLVLTLPALLLCVTATVLSWEAMFPPG